MALISEVAKKLLSLQEQKKNAINTPIQKGSRMWDGEDPDPNTIKYQQNYKCHWIRSWPVRQFIQVWANISYYLAVGVAIKSVLTFKIIN